MSGWRLAQWICDHLVKRGAKGGPFVPTEEPRLKFNGLSLERATDGGWTFGLLLDGKTVATYHHSDPLYPGQTLTLVDNSMIGSVPVRVVG